MGTQGKYGLECATYDFKPLRCLRQNLFISILSLRKELLLGAKMAQLVSARPLCRMSQVRFLDLVSLLRLLFILCSLSSFKYS